MKDSAVTSVTTIDEFRAHVQALTSAPGWSAPAAFAVGVATWSNVGDATKVLDTYYPVVNHGDNVGFAALVADLANSAPSGTVELSADVLDAAVELSSVVVADGGDHPNAALLPLLRRAIDADPGPFAVRRAPVLTCIADLSAPPSDAHDVYLRLHLLSHRRVEPNSVNLDGIFGLLSNVVWTDHGPADPEGFEAARAAMRLSGRPVTVFGIDKFPRMCDYVIPPGVRVADADRVRLGAHLAEGTTVMHEGYVNFNAGTLGNAMIEGRISAGVVVGSDSDVGGGASIMGTLSGGGKLLNRIGERALLGANAGIGISLGDDSIVEAGLYVTAGTLVTLADGSTVKAAELSGRPGLLFRRNSVSGAVETIERTTGYGGLNASLHDND